MDLASPWCYAREETRRLFFLASFRCLQNVQKWAVSLSSVPNKDEQVMELFSQVRDQIFYLWCEMRRVSLNCEIVFQCLGSKEFDWWLEIRCCHDNFKERCSHGIYGHFASTTSYLFLNPKPSAIGRTPFLLKKLPNFCVKYWKNRTAYRWRNTVLQSSCSNRNPNML